MARVSSRTRLRPSSRSFGGVPLGQGVGAAAFAACAHGQGRNAQRKGNVGVGRAEAEIGAQAQMAVDGAQSFEQRGIGGQMGGGAVADFVELRRSDAARAGLRGVVDFAAHWRARRRLRRRDGARLQGAGAGRGLVERKSMEAWALSGMELTLVPPWMVPRLSVVRGSSGSGVSARAARAAASAAMGLGVPASVKLWPPGPVMVT